MYCPSPHFCSSLLVQIFPPVLLESSRVQGDTVSGVGDEENMCVLSVEWSETIVSCGGSVTYNLTVTPCPSGSGDCDMNDMTFSGLEENQHSFIVNGSVSLEYELTVSTVTCGDVTTSPVYRVDLSGLLSMYKSALTLKFVIQLSVGMVGLSTITSCTTCQDRV